MSDTEPARDARSSSALSVETVAVARKRPAGRWSVLHGALALVVGAGTGLFAISALKSRSAARFAQLQDAQRAHARVLFCFAPAGRSLEPVRRYALEANALGQLASPYGVELLAQQAILEERSKSLKAEEAWQKAESNCHGAGMAACSREALRSLAAAACRAQ